MRSQTEVSFYRGGVQVGPPLLLNQVDAHPDITDALSWDDLWNIVTAVYHGFTGQWTSVANDLRNVYTNALKSKNVLANRNSQIELLQGGGLAGNNEPVDEAKIWFRGWSEDDLTMSFGRVDPISQIHDLGERRFQRGDEKWYEHGFSLPLGTLPVGEYIFSFASGDDGWWFDVGVACQLKVLVKPRPPGAPGRATFAISRAVLA